MSAVQRRTRELQGIEPGAIPYDELIDAGSPVILRGLVSDWPSVRAGLRSDRALMDYLRGFDAGRPVVTYTAEAEARGRFFYDETMTRLNFSAARRPLDAVLHDIEAAGGRQDEPCHYVGSTDLQAFLPGFAEENALPLGHPTFAHAAPLQSIWFGNRTIATAHFDMSNNIACCVAGRRRFTLFPPDQAGNLYPGPLEPTPGGQVVSMVDFANPDLERFPRFADARAAGEIAELGPGDALLYPALWWHHVEGLEPFNVLVNTWWNRVPAHVDTPWTTLLHGLLSLRSRPQAEREAWRALFDHYVFGPPEAAAEHLPPPARGPLGELDPATARALRRMILNKLNR
ncbi:cupin-like domain-containing protein [Parvularcula oceani]|uniref:cupin-like domain-containing protein n=1 Tax=Parvularcula oceani TaxID=1247963 RepID=UPI0004E1023B|nr:cupin-like domain-containing protein [Parvularcula oceani]